MKISCNGSSDSASKHPLIYLKINEKTDTICQYCSKKFVVTKQKNNKTYIEISEAINNQEFN